MATQLYPAINADIPRQAAETIGRVPAFDPITSRFLARDGALVERQGREAVQQWIDLMLRQQPNRVPIYQTADGANQLGIDRDLLGRKLPNGLITAEIERAVRETLSYNPAIREVRDFAVTRRGRACTVTFAAVLYTGESLEVAQDV